MAQEHFNQTSSPNREGDLHGTQSIPELIRGVAYDISTLFSKELALAKAEMREAANSAKAGLSGMAVGAGIAFGGLVMLLLSAVYALNDVVEPWLSALIVGLAALLVGFLLLKSGEKKVEPTAFVPEKTIDSVRKDKETVRESCPMNNTQHNKSDDHKSSDALEREVDQVRARLNTRAHELSSRLSPGELLDQSLHMVRDHAGEFGHNLSVQVKQNPLPTIITGLGMAWMMLSSNKEITHYYEPATDYVPGDYDDVDGHPDMVGRAGETLGRAGETLKDSAERAGQTFRNSAEKARHLRESVSGRVHYASDSLRSQAHNTRYRVQSFLEEQPIVAGGLGMALGAFLGALIPPTEVEDRTLGHASDDATLKARQAASQQYARAKAEARDVMENAKSSVNAGDGASSTGNSSGGTASRAGDASSREGAGLSSSVTPGATNVSDPGGTSY